MKTIRFYLGITIVGLTAFLANSCKTGTPGDAVRNAMEKEIIKEESETFIEEHNVPAVIVKEFNNRQSDTIERQWLVFEQLPEDTIKLELPEVYIVKYSQNSQDYRSKYSIAGEIIEKNHLINISVLPVPAQDVLKKGEYKDWEVVGDVFETLDNKTDEPIGFIVKVKKGLNKEKVFFDLEGNMVKIQTMVQ